MVVIADTSDYGFDQLMIAGCEQTCHYAVIRVADKGHSGDDLRTVELTPMALMMDKPQISTDTPAE